MNLKIAIQMDPIAAIDIEADSTFVLALAAQARGHALYVYGPDDLRYDEGRIFARAHPLSLRRVAGAHATFGQPIDLDLTQMDIVLMRQDPPFDMQYLGAAHLLEMIHPDTLVVNNPRHVRNAPEKLFALHFPDLIAPTLVTRDRTAIRAFRDRHADIIIKPLFGNGGAGVFHLKPDDDNLGALLDVMLGASREPLMAQAFLPAIQEGDKRVILVDGEPIGAINRLPPVGDARANMHAGGRAEKAELDDDDRRICAAIGPHLKEMGLIFVGIDVIGGKLTEINVTSPTGLQELKRFDGGDPAMRVWEAIEAKR